MNPADEIMELMIPKEAVAPLFNKFGFVRGELSGFLGIPETWNEQAMSGALAWWEKLSPDDRMIMQAALATLAGPQLIADISMISGSHEQLVTRLIMDSRKPTDPVYLIGEDTVKKQFKIQRLLHRDLAINTLILQLAGTDPVLSDSVLKFDLTRNDFYVLAALIDLQRRLRYYSLMDHLPVPTTFTFSELEKSVSDGYTNADIRWLLPFVLSTIPKKHQPLPKDAIQLSATKLIELKMIQTTADPDKYTWSEPGRVLAESLSRPKNCLGLLITGALEDGNLAMQSVLIAHGEGQLWLADLSGPNGSSAFISTVTFEDVRSVLEGLLKPLGTPRPLEVVKSTDRRQPQMAVPLAPGVKQAPIQAAARTASFCGNCGQPLTPGKKFCSNCGTPIDTAESSKRETNTCPKCGGILKPGATFCRHCGNKIQ